jgi:hypothetical protein
VSNEFAVGVQQDLVSQFLRSFRGLRSLHIRTNFCPSAYLWPILLHHRSTLRQLVYYDSRVDTPNGSDYMTPWKTSISEPDSELVPNENPSLKLEYIGLHCTFSQLVRILKTDTIKTKANSITSPKQCNLRLCTDKNALRFLYIHQSGRRMLSREIQDMSGPEACTPPWRSETLPYGPLAPRASPTYKFLPMETSPSMDSIVTVAPSSADRRHRRRRRRNIHRPSWMGRILGSFPRHFGR